MTVESLVYKTVTSVLSPEFINPKKNVKSSVCACLCKCNFVSSGAEV